MKRLWLSLLLIAIVIVFAEPAHSAAPEINYIEITDPIYLDSGTVTEIICNATINDSDGYDNISVVSAVFYDNASANASSSDDNNYHYSNASCNIAGSGNTVNASCSFLIWYYANPSDDWICSMNASDSMNTTNGYVSASVEALAAMSVTAISYTGKSGGAISLGNISNEAVMNITNTGNVNLSFELSGGNISCVTGIIPVSNQSYSINSGFNYSNGTLLTSTPTEVSNFIVPPRTDDAAPSTSNIYWLLAVPGYGAGGNCTGTISINGYE